MAVFNAVTIAHVPVVTDERTSGGWIGWMAIKMIPAAIADRPDQRMRFEALVFIGFLSVSWSMGMGFVRLNSSPLRDPNAPPASTSRGNLVLARIVYSSQGHWSPCLTTIRTENEAECNSQNAPVEPSRPTRSRLQIYDLFPPQNLQPFRPVGECRRHFYSLISSWGTLGCNRLDGKIRRGSGHAPSP